MEDTDDSPFMEASSSYQQTTTPNYPPPSYNQSIQQSNISSFQSSSMAAPVNQLQPPPYQGSQPSFAQSTFQQQSQQPAFQQQNQIPAAVPVAAAFQSQQPNAAFPTFNNATPTSFPSSSATVPKQDYSMNMVGDPNANPDSKLTMIKSFSNESGMNDEWAKK